MIELVWWGWLLIGFGAWVCLAAIALCFLAGATFASSTMERDGL